MRIFRGGAKIIDSKSEVCKALYGRTAALFWLLEKQARKPDQNHISFYDVTCFSPLPMSTRRKDYNCHWSRTRDGVCGRQVD